MGGEGVSHQNLRTKSGKGSHAERSGTANPSHRNAGRRISQGTGLEESHRVVSARRRAAWSVDARRLRNGHDDDGGVNRVERSFVEGVGGRGEVNTHSHIIVQTFCKVQY